MQYEDKVTWLKSLLGALPGGPWHVRVQMSSPSAEVLAGTKHIAFAASADVADAIAELPDLLANAPEADLASKVADLADLAEEAIAALRKTATKDYSRAQRAEDADELEDRLKELRP